ncbi:uncharacterized protein LOC144660038 isoform X4 [Oculina patagonica]
MKNLAIAILVFCTFICAVHSFHCYQCECILDADYTTDQCEHDQFLVDCPDGANNTCFESRATTTYGTETIARGCMTKDLCENFVQVCKNGTEEEMEAVKIKQCEGFCCMGDGNIQNIPCNSGFTVSDHVITIMFPVLCSLKIF